MTAKEKRIKARLEQIKDRATRFQLGDGESKGIDLKLVNR